MPHLPPQPLLILIRPQMGENIGAVARAMANFGLTELRLVAPRDGWPNPKAIEMASGAESIIESARIYPDVAAVMADIHLAYATTARPRDIEKRVLTPSEAMVEISHRLSQDAVNIALVLGPERSGLEKEDIVLCDTIITIPTAPVHRSLNLAQSAVILGYEWWKVSSHAEHSVSVEKDDSMAAPQNDHLLANKEEWTGLFAQLESYLDAADYFRVDHKKPIMWQNLRTMMLRAHFTVQEVRTFRGMLRALWERRLKN